MAEQAPRQSGTSTRFGDDRALLLAFHRGNEGAARDLWERHAARLRVYARSIVGSGSADDVVQVVFLRVLALRRGTIRKVRDPAAWLCTLTRNAALNAQRRQQRTERHESRSSALSGSEDNAPLEIDALLADVPGPLREALVLRHAYGFSLERLAEAMGVSRSTAADRYAKGLRCAREKLEVVHSKGDPVNAR